MIDPDARIKDGTDGGLSRGFFLSNSEVGKKRVTLTKFMFRVICGNHIVWGAENVEVVRVKHIGKDAEKRSLAAIQEALKGYADASATEDEALIKKAQTTLIQSDYDGLEDYLFGKKWLSRKDIKSAYAEAENHVDTDGDPRSYWGFANGLTRISQDTVYADARADMDLAASQILNAVRSMG